MDKDSLDKLIGNMAKAKAFADLQNSPSMKALEAIMDNDNLDKLIGNSAATKAFADLQNSASMKAIEAMNKQMSYLKSFEMPKITPFSLPKMPSQEETNDYQSARVLMRRLADTIMQWRKQLPDDKQPAILAILNGGIQIRVERLAQESFHGIRVEGQLNNNPCMLLAHQASLQLLCYVEAVQENEFKRKIGFIIDGEEEQI